MHNHWHAASLYKNLSNTLRKLNHLLGQGTNLNFDRRINRSVNNSSYNEEILQKLVSVLNGKLV